MWGVMPSIRRCAGAVTVICMARVKRVSLPDGLMGFSLFCYAGPGDAIIYIS